MELRGPFGRRSDWADQSTVLQRQQEDTSDRPGACPPLFTGLLPSDYKEVSAAARAKEFARGELIYIEGDSVRQILLLTSGIVKVTQLGLSGVEVILRLGVPGDTIGALDLCSVGRHRTTALALHTCGVLAWDAPVFKALEERFPVLRQNMVRILGEDLLELEERFREVATERVGPRVARQLVRLLGKIGRPVNGEVEVCISREELAQMTGTTLFTVSRLLSAWQARGMVKPRRGAVAICNVQSLREISQESFRPGLCSAERGAYSALAAGG